jgi:hypothetical protein
MTTVRIIEGHPGGPNGKWDEVQAIQHEPFIYIMYAGHSGKGDIAEILEMLATYKLREDLLPCATPDVCGGIVNPEWGYQDLVPYFIDGPRLYACNGVVRFSGNFENYSYAFGVDTNHKPTIEALMLAVGKNASLVEVQS